MHFFLLVVASAWDGFWNCLRFRILPECIIWFYVICGTTCLMTRSRSIYNNFNKKYNKHVSITCLNVFSSTKTRNVVFRNFWRQKTKYSLGFRDVPGTVFGRFTRKRVRVRLYGIRVEYLHRFAEVDHMDQFVDLFVVMIVTEY